MVHDMAMQHPVAGIVGDEGDLDGLPGRNQDGISPFAMGDGGKRSLICSLCATEWDFRRIVCPAAHALAKASSPSCARTLARSAA